MNDCTAFKRMALVPVLVLTGYRILASEPTRILCYGDSTTWGQVGSDAVASGKSYPCRLQNLLGSRYDVKNISLGGSTVADMLVWRGVRELRTKPFWGDSKKTTVVNDIVLKKDGSFTGIAFTGDSNPFCLVASGEDDICRGYAGYPVYGSATEAAGLFWPSHDGAAFTAAEAAACGLPAKGTRNALADYGEHRADGIGRCRCYYDPDNAAKFVDVEVRYSSSLVAAMRLLEPQPGDIAIPSGSRIVPIDTTETWKGDLHIIMFGLNDTGFVKAKYWDLVKEATDRIVADGGRYLVLMSQSACASRITSAQMQEYFGDRYLDLYGKFTERDGSGDYKCFAYAENLGYTNVRTTELQQYAKIPITFSTDKLHPLEIGYDLIAHWVYDKLVELGEVEPEPGPGPDGPQEPDEPQKPDEPETMGVGWGWSNRVTVAGQDYCVLAFTNTAAGFAWIVPSGVTSVDYLVVGGGGAGGAVVGGGGGAGGLATGSAVVSSGVALSVKVGAGGIAPTGEADGGDGAGSSLFRGDVCVAAVQGGGGGGSQGRPGHDGGCGGGGARSTDAENATAGGAALAAGQGFAGGTGATTASQYTGSGGGGGAGAAGGNGAGRAGEGGKGVSSSITGEEVWYAGGGGGAMNKSAQGAGGLGGGGAGGTNSIGNPESGKDGLGGGGGGSRAAKYGQPGKGGDGIVLIRYAVSGGEGPVEPPDEPPVGPDNPPDVGTPVLTAPAEGARINPLSWGQQLARATDYTAPTTADFSRYANPIRLEWTGTTGPAEVTVRRASDGHCIWQCVSETGDCDVYNYYIGEEHVWTVRTEAGSASGHFTVMQFAPRMIYTHNSEGCFSNMRDEGGYRGLGGRRVRQGLIYRSCQFDSQSQGGTGGGKPTLDATGLYDMTNRLGIKTDLDLRNDAETGGISGSGLGPNVRWIHISGLYPGSVGGSGSPTGAMRKELAVLLDPANYPLDFHCKGGRDRTGALGFVALGLLGVSERDLYLDYVWTWEMPDPNGHIGDWDAMIAGLSKLAGNTICEKLETLVRQCGFTDADIAAYREAMLEPLADPPAHFHDTTLAEHVLPTCSAEGRDVYSCTNAGCTVPPYAVTNVLPIVAHAWGDWMTAVEPTLGQAGLRRRTCSACKGAEEIAIDALKPAAEATGAGWGQVVTQQVDGVLRVTVSFTDTTRDWRWTLPQEVTSFDFLAVAGGGSGGVARGGGGGAGGVVTGTVAVAASGATLRAMVGAGGAAQTAVGDGNDGESTYLRLNDAEVLAVYGGGGGGHYEVGRESFGRAGGNGGGAGGNGVAATVSGGAARTPHFGAVVTHAAAFGTAGGAGATSGGAYPGGGGGGGALMAGGDGTPKSGGGAGGDGLVSLLGGAEMCFAGGGGGACSKSTPGPGGAGGGGTGGDTPTAGVNGLGGGGGGSRSLRYGASGAGGSGVVIIRYAVPAEEQRKQEFNPSAGVRELDVEAADAAAALEAVGFVSPDASVVSAEDYSAYFTKSATRNADGTWHVTVALREDEVRPVIAGGDGDTACFSVADGKVSMVIGNVKPGLYYGYLAAESLSGLSSANAILADEPARSASDVKLTVETDASASLFLRAVVSDARGQNDIL